MEDLLLWHAKTEKGVWRTNRGVGKKNRAGVDTEMKKKMRMRMRMREFEKLSIECKEEYELFKLHVEEGETRPFGQIWESL